MKHFKTVNYKKFLSFSLIEVLVFVTVLSLFFIAGLSVALYSFYQLKHAEYKTLASYYAQEALEWIKKEKELDWNSFVTHATTAGSTYCLNNLSWENSRQCGDNFGINYFYKREAILRKSNDNNSVFVDLSVYWQEKDRVNNINIKSLLNLWE